MMPSGCLYSYFVLFRVSLHLIKCIVLANTSTTSPTPICKQAGLNNFRLVYCLHECHDNGKSKSVVWLFSYNSEKVVSSAPANGNANVYCYITFSKGKPRIKVVKSVIKHKRWCRSLHKIEFKGLSCYEKSIMVSTPINRVAVAAERKCRKAAQVPIKSRRFC